VGLFSAKVRRTIVIVLAGAAVVSAAYLHHRDDGRAARGSAGALPVLYAYSSNQEELLLPLIQTFNDEGHELAGRRIEIVGESVSSGDAETGSMSRSTAAVQRSSVASVKKT
jgi:hypothetical protein